jgi:hypothetical protein
MIWPFTTITTLRRQVSTTEGALDTATGALR